MTRGALAEEKKRSEIKALSAPLPTIAGLRRGRGHRRSVYVCTEQDTEARGTERTCPRPARLRLIETRARAPDSRACVTFPADLLPLGPKSGPGNSQNSQTRRGRTPKKWTQELEQKCVRERSCSVTHNGQGGRGTSVRQQMDGQTQRRGVT